MTDPAAVELTAPQLAALGAMPVRLTSDGFLPRGVPSGGLMTRLEAKGLIQVDYRGGRPVGWARTELGEAVWNAR